MSILSEFNTDTGPQGFGHMLGDLGSQIGGAFSRGAEGRSIVGNFGTAILGGAMGASGAEGAEGAGAGEGLGALGNYSNWLSYIKNGGGALYNMFRGMQGGNGQSPQASPSFFSPFSPPQSTPADTPYRHMQFQNVSFNPWMQNVGAMQMPTQQMPGPAQHIFGQRQGFF